MLTAVGVFFVLGFVPFPMVHRGDHHEIPRRAHLLMAPGEKRMGVEARSVCQQLDCWKF